MNNQDTQTSPWSLQDALVAMMVATSASDENIRTLELLSIQRIVDHLPIFGKYDAGRMRVISQTVFDLIEEEDGLDALFGLVRAALPEKFFETAYALICDVAAADGRLRESELRFLEETRYELNIDRPAWGGDRARGKGKAFDGVRDRKIYRKLYFMRYLTKLILSTKFTTQTHKVLLWRTIRFDPAPATHPHIWLAD